MSTQISTQFYPITLDSEDVAVWTRLHDKAESAIYVPDALNPIERELYDALTRKFTELSQMVGFTEKEIKPEKETGMP